MQDVGREEVLRKVAAAPAVDGRVDRSLVVHLDRDGDAVAAAVDRAPNRRWECNVGDPQDLTFGALAALVAERLGWDWELVPVAWDEGDHPWNVRHPVVTDTSRLQQMLGVTEPESLAATARQIDWLWENREDAAALPG